MVRSGQGETLRWIDHKEEEEVKGMGRKGKGRERGLKG